MISSDDYLRHDGLGLAALVRAGEVSAAELLEVALARIAALNPRLNAVVRLRAERARAEVAQIDRAAPLAGVPFLLKDLIATLAGEPTGCGTQLLQAQPMPQDSELVRRFRAAGLVIAGRTSTPEFGLMPFTEPELHGAVHNPWSALHSPGGSSGGSAAAVAAGIVPIASGGDGGGSIRIPASCCGLFGFKPSRGTTPTGPNFGELWQGFAIEHVLTRSVRDSAAVLDATAGSDGGAPYASPRFERPLLEEVTREPGRLRIAFTHRPLFGHAPVHADCIAALTDAARLLESLGHHVEESTPPLDHEACATAFATIVSTQAWDTIRQVAQAAQRKPARQDFELASWTAGLLGRATSGADYVAAVNTLQLAARGLAPFFARHDVLLTPTLATPPIRIGALQPTATERQALGVLNTLGSGALLKALGAVRVQVEKTFGYMPFTPLFNATGQPAMSVPLCWNADGLPIGVQLAAPLGEDARLFQLAGQLERARPWFERRPKGFGAGADLPPSSAADGMAP